MKKFLIAVLTAATALTSFDRDALTTENNALTFDLTANYPSDKEAFKCGWETGDVILVFLSGVAAPGYLKMEYDGNSWKTREMNGNDEGATGLQNGDGGTMRAIYLPFTGKDVTVSVGDNGSFSLGNSGHSYYLTATKDYSVSDNILSGTFDMAITDGYKIFFVQEAGVRDGEYVLGSDAVIPTGLESVAADGTINETSDRKAGDDMPGYACKGGCVFSGRLTGDYPYGGYYFAKTKVSDGSRADWFILGKDLPGNPLVIFPPAGQWQKVGEGVSVRMVKDGKYRGTWFTCNLGSTKPEDPGVIHSYEEAVAQGITLPSKQRFWDIEDTNTWTWLSVHGQTGMVVRSDTGFLFLPAFAGFYGDYWSSTTDSLGEVSRGMFFNYTGYHRVMYNDRHYACSIRPVKD
ncbi:MAG: hypothetical protein IJK96_03935 [Bacteroidales bacterium]|nr:hypothetical protein [Bacteroidales bacterium]